MSETVKEITEVVKDSQVAGEVAANISDQINSVVNNFASKAVDISEDFGRAYAPEGAVIKEIVENVSK